MPELPEVETIRRHLEPFVVGRRLEKLEISDPMWCEPAPPATLDDAVRGRRIEALGRRGKYLIWTFEDEIHLVMHLRMTGNLLLIGEQQPPYTRVLMPLDTTETDRVHGPAPVRDRSRPARRRGARRLLQEAPRRGAAQPRLHDRPPA